MDATRTARVFGEMYDEIPAARVQRIVERVDVTDMVAVQVDAGFIGGDAVEADAAHDALASVGRASRSARTCRMPRPRRGPAPRHDSCVRDSTSTRTSIPRSQRVPRARSRPRGCGAIDRRGSARSPLRAIRRALPGTDCPTSCGGRSARCCRAHGRIRTPRGASARFSD